MRTRHSVWWPGVSQSISQKVLQCPSCAKEAKHRREPLITTLLSEYPWQVVGTDLFELDGSHYVLVVDYFSRYPEVTKLTSTLSNNIINTLKVAFSWHGIPEIVRSDNGPQYCSLEFAKFASCYGFQHLTSSPLYPQSNGQAEHMVKTVKSLLKQSSDPI